MPRLGLEPAIPVFERVKTKRAFDRAATVICHQYSYKHEIDVCYNECKQFIISVQFILRQILIYMPVLHFWREYYFAT
jgi:hypothetical protein